jgi:hypothetical protein
MQLQKLLSNIWIEGAYANIQSGREGSSNHFMPEAIPRLMGEGGALWSSVRRKDVTAHCPKSLKQWTYQLQHQIS